MDLHEVPNILEEYQNLPETHQLTQNNLPTLTAAEELALVTFSNFLRFEALDMSTRSLMDMVAEQISSTWNNLGTQEWSGKNFVLPFGTRLATCAHWAIGSPLENSFPTIAHSGALSKILGPHLLSGFVIPLSFIFRLTCHRALPAGCTT